MWILNSLKVLLLWVTNVFNCTFPQFADKDTCSCESRLIDVKENLRQKLKRKRWERNHNLVKWHKRWSWKSFHPNFGFHQRYVASKNCFVLTENFERPQKHTQNSKIRKSTVKKNCRSVRKIANRKISSYILKLQIRTIRFSSQK